MPQLSYTQGPPPAQPGMPFDAELSSRDVVSRPCAVNIAFGVYCELDANGNAVPMQDSTTGGSFAPLKLGISVFDPLGIEQAYTTWTVPATLAGTVAVTAGSASVTFSTNQTLPQGQPLVFDSQPGVEYFLAQAIAAGTVGTLTTKYGGATAAAAKTTLPGAGSTAVGWRAGQVAPFMRRGRIWVAGDASGTSLQTGAINVVHSSDGTHPQGVFTFRAVQATAGNEIDIAPGCTAWNPGLSYQSQYTDPFGNTFSIYCVEIDI